MSYGTPLAINRVATGAITPYRIVKGTATDGEVTQAAAGGDKLVGVAGQVGADAAGDRIDINHAGVVPVEFGGNVAFGDELTSDANGKAVVALTTNRVIGIALENGDDTTIGSMLIAPSTKP